MTPLSNLNVVSFSDIISPAELIAQIPVYNPAIVQQGRQEIANILDGIDKRLLVVVGPCSIHDKDQAIEYARRLAQFRDKLKDKMVIIMRAYFEKPRTTVGWKGLLYDPGMDASNRMEEGFLQARKIINEINALGLSVATEFLDPIIPQYIADMVSWASIGARTTESQTHRQMASGLSMPVGYKNGTDGSYQVALDAMKAGLTPHTFLGVNDQTAKLSLVHTRGNPNGHIVLRGGNGHPNYDRATLNEVHTALQKAGLNTHILVDCSHANSCKQHKNQRTVWNAVLAEFKAGDVGVMGMMLESNFCPGNQKIPADLSAFDRSKLQWGVSVTDECIGWEETVEILISTYTSL